MDWEKIKSLSEAAFSWTADARRALHRIPENGFEEFKTQKYICQKLDELNIPYETERTWVIGLIKGAGPGRTIALRADMDALPVEEPPGCAFGSTHPGFMHACGHDAHMAIQLGAAHVLAGLRDQLNGSVKLLFQPAEETVGGAKPMVEAGALENPRVDATYGLHVQPGLRLGTVETRYGALNASTDDIDIVVHGRGGHAAYPENSVDAIVCAAQMVCALQTLISRNVSPLKSAVLTFGAIEGGAAPNIICERVKLRGTLRTADPALRTELKDRVQAVADGVAAAFGARAEVVVREGYAALINHAREAKLILDVAEGLFGVENALIKESPSMGGEDFSYFIEDRPGAFYHIGATPAEKLPAPGLHSPLFSLDENCLKTGVAMQVGIVLRELGAV